MLISIKYTLWQFLSWKPVQWRDDRISQAKNSWNGQLLSTRQDFLLVEPFGGKIKIVCSTASEFIRHSAIFFKKMGHSRPLFHLFSSFLQAVNNNCSIKVADDLIRTRGLWSNCATTTALITAQMFFRNSFRTTCKSTEIGYIMQRASVKVALTMNIRRCRL